jgi:RimJ/RimL family protein N-acetyltransferase
MVKQHEGRPKRIFRLQRLKAQHLEVIADWVSPYGDTSAMMEAWRQRLYTAFQQQFGNTDDEGGASQWVMTRNGRPVFCFNLQRLGSGRSGTAEGHLYLLPGPAIRRSTHLLQRAWQAAAVHAFLVLKMDRVQVAVDAQNTEEQAALQLLGFRRLDVVNQHWGTLVLYRCDNDGIRIVM